MIPLIKLLATVVLAWGILTLADRLIYHPPPKRRKR